MIKGGNEGATSELLGSRGCGGGEGDRVSVEFGPWVVSPRI